MASAAREARVSPGAAWWSAPAPAARRATSPLAPHRLPPALPVMESAPRMPRAPLFRGSLCRRYLQSARENEIGRVQRERK